MYKTVLSVILSKEALLQKSFVKEHVKNIAAFHIISK